MFLRNTHNMGNKATTINQQIQKLRDRGVVINDEEKAKENLLDIGYFRLCSYLFPFEKTYPKLKNRNHEFKAGTQFEDAVTLYYLDFDLRTILFKYITRIEVAFRTYVTYTLSNKYIQSPTWFVDPKYIDNSFITKFELDLYNEIRKNPVIKRHHTNHINDRFAPAWKTLEYMTLGGMETLYKNIKELQDKLTISKYFGVKQTAVFEQYIETVRRVRNICAHGGILFDLSLPKGITNGPAGRFSIHHSHKLTATIQVIEFLLQTVSKNRVKDMQQDIKEALDRAISKNPKLKSTIIATTGISR